MRFDDCGAPRRDLEERMHSRRNSIRSFGGTCATLLLAACSSRGPVSPPPPAGWHDAYLVVNSIEYTEVYALRADGTYTQYRPNQVDSYEHPCGRRERERHDWCIYKGRQRFEAPDVIVVVGQRFHIDRDGKYCFVPRPEDDGLYEAKCEDESRDDALKYIQEAETGKVAEWESHWRAKEWIGPGSDHNLQ